MEDEWSPFHPQWVIKGRLARAARPGRFDGVSERSVRGWIEAVKAMGVNSIICLLSDDELRKYYSAEGISLLEVYSGAGFRVSQVPVPDYQEPTMTLAQLDAVVDAVEKLPEPVLVHCSAGASRTGEAVEVLENVMRAPKQN
jgi:protein-tyrosine phosphatase